MEGPGKWSAMGPALALGGPGLASPPLQHSRTRPTLRVCDVRVWAMVGMYTLPSRSLLLSVCNVSSIR